MSRTPAMRVRAPVVCPNADPQPFAASLLLKLTHPNGNRLHGSACHLLHMWCIEFTE